MSDLATRAAAAARAAGDEPAAAMIERGRLEVLAGDERATIEGRSVAALRVALWLPAADRVQVRDRPELLPPLRRAIATALESPESILRELLVLQERTESTQEGTKQALSRTAGEGRGEGAPYRTAPAPAELLPEVIAATAAALADASGAAEVAGALRRSRMAREPLGPGVSRVTVALDPADLALVRRDPRIRAAAVAAVESAARTPDHRAADVAFTVRAATPELPSAARQAETELTAAARRAGWAVVPIARTAARTTLALIGDEKLIFIHLTDGEVPPPTKSTELVVAPKDVPDEIAALKLVERLEKGT